jgi:transposase
VGLAEGHEIGTIVVDLERRRVVDLLADRAADRMADWFKEHPEVEIINRDRDGLYADAARNALPGLRTTIRTSRSNGVSTGRSDIQAPRSGNG